MLVPRSAAPVAGLSIHANVVDALAYASHQNAAPLLYSLRIRYDGLEPIEDLDLEFATEPALCRPRRWRIDRLHPNATLEIPQVEREIEFDAAALRGLTEAVRGEAVFRLSKDGVVLAETRQGLRFLTRSEWGGLSAMPELLAAFCLPNAPAVQDILKSASAALAAAGRRDAIDGYLAQDRARVWEIASAVWSAVAGLGLSYAVPPASFERVGQKVRTPDRIVEDRLATCLDSAMLFASALEQAGLDPIVLFTRGHAFTGCWLRPSEATRVLSENEERLRAEIRLGNLLVFETTRVTGTAQSSFSTAIEIAEKQLALDAPEPFQAALDIRRARLQGILPLDVERPRVQRAAEVGAMPELDPAPKMPARPMLVDPVALRSRLAAWSRKLLDLSKRNRLLNLRDGEAVLPLRLPDPDKALALLERGEAVEIAALAREAGAQSNVLLMEIGADEDSRARELLAHGELAADLKERDLERRLTTLQRRAKAALQESGAGVLYLALGMVRWRETPGAATVYRAPLLLAPLAIRRQGARGRFRLTRTEDGVQVNATLLELMRQELGVECPQIEAIVEAGGPSLVADAFRAAHAAMREIDGFELEETAAVSVFSFAKFFMWRDLTALEDRVAQNRLIRHLIESPREPYAHARPLPPPTALDEALPATRDMTALPADASQLAAVYAASMNQDFVLIGPPGSGKSQTIVNVIAQCLAEGRSVLFVSAKTAALDVVRRRLRAIGLGDLCLEIHSAKASKEGIVAQLRAALQAQPALADAARERLVRDVGRAAELRAANGALRDALHRRRPSGLSAYEALGAALRERAAAPPLRWAEGLGRSESELEEMRRTLRRIDALARVLRPIAGHPLRLAAVGVWSEAWRADLVARAEALRAALPAVAAAPRRLADHLGVRTAATARAAIDAQAPLVAALADPRAAWVALALSTRLDRIAGDVDAARDLAARLEARAGALSAAYAPEAWTELDIPRLDALWRRAQSANWARAKALRARVLTALRRPARGLADPERDLPQLLDAWRAARGLKALDRLGPETFGLFQGAETDFAALDDAIARAKTLRDALARLRSLGAGARILADRAVARFEQAAAPRFWRAAGLSALESGRLAEIAAAHAQYAAARTAFEALAGRELCETLPDQAAEDGLSALDAALVEFLASLPELRAWCAWRRLRARALEQGLQPVVEALEHGRLQPGGAREAFERALTVQEAERAIDAEPALAGFAAAPGRVASAEIGEYAAALRAVRPAAILDACLARRPDPREVGADPEMRVLAAEIERRRGGPALREFLAQIPTLLPRLTPCLLMSPMSIAQHLDVAKTTFDVVIFDEASQISTWDAVGAIARGRQTIVVGDPKQLPPTSFFDRQDVEAEDAGEVEDDLESVLDECLAAQLPTLRLDWHYRSRDESLIAFSNRLYYGAGLTTFPAPEPEARRVRLRRVEGRYLRGGARTNPAEAEALAAELVARLKRQLEGERPESFGVITFNAEQQRLIEDLLDAARQEEPGLERFFSDDLAEPVIVKNLEAIQGDERDVILFSTTFGPDDKGEIALNFGPLNKSGGERRLNVAVTRARAELLVFASLSAADIDLGRTDARGVRDLKRFLDYADRGAAALPRIAADGAGPPDAFADVVAATLAGRGWAVDRAVGLSGGTIDIAVRDPANAERYLAAVECDGPSWARGATALDREATRRGVLAGLGWESRREHVLEWRADPDGAADRLDAHLRRLAAAGGGEHAARGALRLLQGGG